MTAHDTDVFVPVERKSLSESVYERIRDEILAGSLAAGDVLPAERRLVERFGVNRQALREAIKRLEQAGLVLVHQGGRTCVRDWRESGGLDLLPALLSGREGLNTALVRDVMEMRLVLGPDIARLCAARADEPVIAELRAVIAAMRAASGGLAALQELSTRFWALLVEGSGNLAYRLAYNALMGTYREFYEPMRVLLEVELRDTDGFAAVAEAVAAHRPGRAQWSARRLLEKGHARMLGALGLVTEDGDAGGVS